MIKLSKRLFVTASMVTEGNKLADVGTDHGYIPIYLVEQKKIKTALAMDIGIGPLERAREHIEENGLKDYIGVRLSDGVKELKKGEADSVVIAGMGGGIIIKILSEGREVLSSVSELILEPQSEVDRVRKYLHKNGYVIDKEDFVKDAGKYYPIMHVIHGTPERELEAWEYAYGPCLVRDKNSVLKEYLTYLCVQYGTILESLEKEDTEGTRERRRVIRQEISQIKLVEEIMRA